MLRSADNTSARQAYKETRPEMSSLKTHRSWRQVGEDETTAGGVVSTDDGRRVSHGTYRVHPTAVEAVA